MKYKVDIVITNRNTFEQKFIEKEFTDREQAEDYKQEILDAMDFNECSHWYKVIPIKTCSCGEEVELSSFTNTCDCGINYNFSGDMLADREQWGSETGERWQDCY